MPSWPMGAPASSSRIAALDDLINVVAEDDQGVDHRPGRLPENPGASRQGFQPGLAYAAAATACRAPSAAALIIASLSAG